jgi:hypothetical protein
MRTVLEILADREADGTDCTEDESALLKRAVKNDPVSPVAFLIASRFPVEYSEASEEMQGEA